MKPMSRLLLIEDDPKEAVMIEQQCCPDASKVAFDVASNASDAEDKIRGEEYDLIICDLALPADARHGDPEVTEGQRLFEMVRQQAPGTPIYILSGNADLHMVEQFFSLGSSADLYGTRTEEPLVRFFRKWKLPDCVSAVQAHIGKTENVDGFPLESDGLSLPLSDERALKIFARTQGARAGQVSPLDGGLSDARTLKLVLYDDEVGGASTRTVAKLGNLRKVLSEASRFNQIAPRLPLGLGAHLLEVVRAGAGLRGALIYEFANDYQATLGGKVLQGEDQGAGEAVRRLEGGLSEWIDNASQVDVTLARLRRELVSDIQLRNAGVEIPNERKIELSIHETTSHRDLHGFNVLVNGDNQPTLIDYGEVGRASAALDPVTLELSVLFHPEMQDAMGAWPASEQAEAWIDLDAFLAGCPVPEFVAACRAWATAAALDDIELLATSYAYSLRQTKFPDTNADLAQAIARGSYERLRSD